MSPIPKIFVSAASGDLRSVRQLVKEALPTIGCHPVEQTNFEPDARTVSDMLEGKISGCQALIHIAGLRYGAGPDPSTHRAALFDDAHLYESPKIPQDLHHRILSLQEQVHTRRVG